MGGDIAMKKFSMSKEKFDNQWLRHFARGLSKKDFEQYVKGQFIWHTFSFELVTPENLLIGDAAREAYNSKDKSQCIFCEGLGGSGVTDKLTPKNDTAENIDAEFLEFYVVAKDYSWTYIKTHEDDFAGPYFLEITT